MQAVAGKLIDAESDFDALSVSDQHRVMTMLDGLNRISDNLLQTAYFGSKTANRLAMIAHNQAMLVNLDEPMETSEILQGVAALNKLASEAAKPALDLIRASQTKDTAALKRKVFFGKE